MFEKARIQWLQAPGHQRSGVQYMCGSSICIAAAPSRGDQTAAVADAVREAARKMANAR